MLRFLLGSISLSVTKQEEASCSPSRRSLSELAGFTTWAQRWGNPLLLSMSRCSLLTRLLLWLYLLSAGSLGSHKAELIRSGRTKNKRRWSDEMQETVEKLEGLLKHWSSGVTRAASGRLFPKGEKTQRKKMPSDVLLLAEESQLREFFLTLFYCQLTQASNHWFRYWEDENMNN